MGIKKSARRFFFVSQLNFNDGIHRADHFTSATVNACVFIDDVGFFAWADAINGAFWDTVASVDARIRYSSWHPFLLRP